jgi:hypothetical protein
MTQQITGPVTPAPLPAPAPAVAPAMLVIQGGALADIFVILQDALNVLSEIPITAGPAGIANVIFQIIQAAVNRITSETGAPINLSSIPTENPLAATQSRTE